jgi:carbonic anhydrase
MASSVVNQGVAWLFALGTSTAIIAGGIFLATKKAKSFDSSTNHHGKADNQHGKAGAQHGNKTVTKGQPQGAVVSDTSPSHGGLKSLKSLANNKGNRSHSQMKFKKAWSYQGQHNPDNWHQLADNWSVCGAGRQQSPINFKDFNHKSPTQQIIFDYGPSNGKIHYNGHTIQVNVKNNNSIKIDQDTYNLIQFHFHTPSEHSFGGQRFPGELHFVHQNDEGHFAVVGFVVKPGANNQFFEQILNRIPKTENDSYKLQSIPLNLIPPKDQSYFSYDGSLTIPPCSEGVRWMVMTMPLELSGQKLRQLAGVLGENARPVQAMYGRKTVIRGIGGETSSQSLAH